ncbi:MAG: DUF1616 domain-containing protein [Candidatus Helarchaeota archaeon]
MTRLKRENSDVKQEKIILSGIIIAIVIVSSMIIYSFFNAQSEHFSSIGLLDENKTTSNYPTTVKNNTPFYLWVDIGNYEGKLNLYLVNITLGNENTTINKSHPSTNTAYFIKKYLVIVENQRSRMIHVNLSINMVINNSRLIFELWKFNSVLKKFQYLGLWTQIWINITKST